MNFTVKIIVLALLFIVLAFSKKDDCGNTPALNKKIVEYVKKNINKKVAKGECWDLAAQALNTAGARWDHNYEFGTVVKDPSKQCVFAGDIIQFEGVELDYQIGNRIFHENLEHHTAIIYEVKDKKKFMLAQQNTSTHGKKVGIDAFDMESISKGNITIYRPHN
jgi:hypothetical protein